MSHRRVEKYDCSDSEMEDYKHRYYKELRDGRVRVRVSGRLFRCPYCHEKREIEYDYEEILRHASRIGNESKSAGFKDRARHLGLVRYLERCVDAKALSSRSTRKTTESTDTYSDAKWMSSRPSARNTIELQERFDHGKNTSLISTTRTTEPFKSYDAMGTRGKSSVRTVELDSCMDTVGMVQKSTLNPATASVEAIADEKSASVQSTLSEPNKSWQLTKETINIPKCEAKEELLVWPWMAVVANIPVEFKDGRYVGESGKKLKEEWLSKGFNLVKVHPLWNYRGHSGFAIVEFNKDWDGFKNAMIFEKSFEMENHGRRDWYTMRRNRGDKLYAWIAREDEYKANGLIGEYLRKNADLKTVLDIETEDKRKNTKLVSNLTDVLEVKNRKCEEIKGKISRTEIFLGNVMRQKEEMIQEYNEGINRLIKG